jgi:hypothetical protein
MTDIKKMTAQLFGVDESRVSVQRGSDSAQISVTVPVERIQELSTTMSLDEWVAGNNLRAFRESLLVHMRIHDVMEPDTLARLVLISLRDELGERVRRDRVLEDANPPIKVRS